MEWETPSFVEIDMNAEVGAYQDDFADDPLVIVCTPGPNDEA